ncbi:MAG: sigma-54-dependent Fis family transcriptional regulator, partial [Rhodoferax sp.]|nr:sigma-54-dependent Fis family transcriptional regulator [Rhodoferax sp.]
MTPVPHAGSSKNPFAIPDYPPLNSPEHETLIGSSHRRSSSFGLRELDQPDFSVAARGQMSEALEANRFLFQHAAPIMETLYHQIANTQSMVLLTARSGMVLHSLGDADFLERASRVALAPGVDWSEKSKGTNAIGTALAEEHPVVVHGAQHYLQANRFLTCSCTPIFDPYGKVIGALDVTGDHRSYHQHTMALARMSAQMIENHMFAAVFTKEVIVRFHSRAEFLGTLMEGIVVLTPEGRFVTANRSAQFQLGLSANALGAHTFSSLFGLSISQFTDRIRTAGNQPVTVCLHNGVTVCCRSEPKARRSFDMPDFGRPLQVAHGSEAAPTPPQPPVQPVQPVQPAPGSAPLRHRESLSSLRYLDTGDPQITAVIQKLNKIRGCDIPVMILGETGTGKDLLAQAIHNDSSRARQHFVSVNCASIPETLIESELFGYEEGAFTGAKRKGSIGKVQLAHGGTLFLDEIGDMPRHLQARLLRVLQERKVSPLGGGKEVEVDVAVVCATNRNLKELIAKGEFREDLYYRLNGLVVRLPALRERQDLEVVARKILSSLCQSATPMGIAAEVMDLFHRFPWPGNFRQLFNLLRTTVVMAGGCKEIGLHHLPDDFLEEAELADRLLPPSVLSQKPLSAVLADASATAS